jgi:hypothetical protein
MTDLHTAVEAFAESSGASPRSIERDGLKMTDYRECKDGLY